MTQSVFCHCPAEATGPFHEMLKTAVGELRMS